MADKSIKFPAKHYVGFQARPSQDEVPLGFMTPDGDDAAAKKRKATVDAWAQGSGYYGANQAKETLPAQTFNNDPMVGFKLGRNVRHGYGWGQGNVKWRIEDPRGFELEITSPNLAQLMGFCSIEQGEIQEQCVWARLGAENILVPVNSDVYTNAARNTQRVAKKASMRDLKIGDTAILQNGDEGVYYGAFYVVSTNHYDGDTRTLDQRLRTSNKKRHLFLLQTPGADGHSSHKFFSAIGSPKLSELMERPEEMTHEEAESQANRMILEEGVSLQEGTNDYSRAIAVSINELTQADFTRTLETVDLDAIMAEAVANNPGKNSWEVRHAATKRAGDGLATVTLPSGETVVIRPSHYWEQKSRAPGGANYNANWASSPRYWELDMSVLDDVALKADRFETVKVSTKSYWGNSTSDKTVSVDARNVPGLVTRYRMTARTSQGTEIHYYR